MTAKSLASKIMKIAEKTTGRECATVEASQYVDKTPLVNLSIPALNIAHSGRVDEGPTWGSNMIVGESKTFKTLFLALQVAEYLNAEPEAICVFTDSEGGANRGYWEAVGAPMDRIIHIQITTIEENSEVLINILDQTSVGDKVVFATDSLGQLDSRAAFKNASQGEGDKRDFTRVQILNTFWRLMTPHLQVFRIPYFWIGGTYDTMDKYKPTAISGGKKGILGCDTIWMITKSQQKDAVETNGKKKEEKTGWNFNIKIEKGRYAREGKVVPITVRYARADDQLPSGIWKWSAILEIAREVGAVEMVSNGWYQRTEKAGFYGDKKVQKAGMTDQWYDELISSPECKALIEKEYRVSSANLVEDKAPEQDSE